MKRNPSKTLREWTMHGIGSLSSAGIRSLRDLVLVKSKRSVFQIVEQFRTEKGIREATPDEVARMPKEILYMYKRSHQKPIGVFNCYWEADDHYNIYLTSNGEFVTHGKGKILCVLCKMPTFVVQEMLDRWSEPRKPYA